MFAIIFGCLENRSCRELLWSIFLGLPSWPCLRAHNLSHLLKVYLRRQAFEDLASGEKVAWQGADSPAFVGSCGSGRLGSEPIILSSLAPKVLTFQGWNAQVLKAGLAGSDLPGVDLRGWRDGCGNAGLDFQGLIPLSLQIQADRASSSKSCASKPNLSAEDGRRSGLEIWLLAFDILFATIFALENRSFRVVFMVYFSGVGQLAMPARSQSQSLAQSLPATLGL